MNGKSILGLCLATVVWARAEVTEDLSSYQTYRQGVFTQDGVEGRGLNVDAFWEEGYRGGGVHIADVEMNWDLNHEDLSGRSFYKYSTTPDWFDLTFAIQHGTNVLGILFANDDGKGMTGLAVDAEGSVWDMASEVLPGGTPGETIYKAADHLSPGDVLQLEISTSIDEAHGVGPAELRKSNWDAIKYAVDKGIVVIQAAGNGGEDLDGPDYATYRSWGDNGAITVGSATIQQERMSNSTYGSPVHVHAWGDTVVATLGTYQWDGVTSKEWHHGVTFDGDDSRAYSFQFSGTSSALPMVSGLVACMQSSAKDLLGRVLTPKEVRHILIETGFPQDVSRVGGHVGPIPDGAKALAMIQKMAGISTIESTDGIGQHESVVLSEKSVHVMDAGTIRLYTLNGRQLHSSELAPHQSFSLAQINLAKGLYIIEIQTASLRKQVRWMAE